jgi:hypothetical protein
MPLHCIKCRAEISGAIEYDCGDWIVRCANCQAKNIFAFTPLASSDLNEVEITGYAN